MKREREERYGTKCGNREDTATVRRLESEKKDTVKRTKSKESTVGWVGFLIQTSSQVHYVDQDFIKSFFPVCLHPFQILMI